MLLTWITSYLTPTVAAGRHLTIFLLAVLLPAGFPHLGEAASGGKTETLPVQKAAPAAVVIEATGTETELRRLIRVKNSVSELRGGPTRFSEAPTGSYGFIAAKHLGLALITQSPDLVLEGVSSSSDAYEIHKLGDGSGLLVGFVGNEAAAHIRPKERPKSVRISLSSNASESSPLIVAVPLEKLMVDQMPRRLGQNRRDGPVMLEMDLQGTANRKSPIER
jgi:hypothetical protein